MKDFVTKAEQQSRESINRLYREIDILHLEINFLNELLLKYMNKTAGYTLSYSKRQREMNEIREKIPEVYNDINFYKECINVEKNEMKRIHKAYGYSHDIKPEYYTEIKLIQYNEFRPENDTEYDLHDDSENEYVPPYNEKDEELEEIKDYRYNHATGLFE
jgi:hypothetical protein